MTKDPKRVEAGKRAYQTYKRNAQARPKTRAEYVAQLAEKIEAAAIERQTREGTGAMGEL